jgi:hypothetical protein
MDMKRPTTPRNNSVATIGSSAVQICGRSREFAAIDVSLWPVSEVQQCPLLRRSGEQVDIDWSIRFTRHHPGIVEHTTGSVSDPPRSLRMCVMRQLPVVPICRTSRPLRCRANQNDALACLAATRGTYRDRHGRRLRDAMDAVCHATSDMTRTAKSCGPDAPRLALNP